MLNVEIIGWIGSALVLLSFFWDGFKMRMINGLGAAFWVLYGVLIGSESLMFVNSAIICIHLYKVLIKLNYLLCLFRKKSV